MKRKVFFQGDSITDAHRDRRDNHNLAGYSLKVAEMLGDQYEYVNYGCSGDTTRQMLARHEQEFLKEKADILVMMAGVNDVWRHFDGHDDAKVDKNECVDNIKKIISISKKINPNVKVIFVEPYFIAGPIPTLVNATDTFKGHLREIRTTIPPLVDKYVYTYEEFLNFQNKGEIIADDGVHPNENGQKKIALKIVVALGTLSK